MGMSSAPDQVIHSSIIVKVRIIGTKLNVLQGSNHMFGFGKVLKGLLGVKGPWMYPNVGWSRPTPQIQTSIWGRTPSNTHNHQYKNYDIRVFLKMVVPQNRWFLIKNPNLKWMIWHPLFLETSMFKHQWYEIPKAIPRKCLNPLRCGWRIPAGRN